MKNGTKNTIQDRHFLLLVTNPQLTLHKWNYLLIMLPLPLQVKSMLFPAPQTVGTYHSLLLALCLKTVPVIFPTEFIMPMAGFIPPWPGSCLNPLRTNYKPITIIFRQKSALLQLPLPLPPRLILKFYQMSLPVEIQLLLPVTIPVNTPQALYFNYHLRRHQGIFHQKNLPKLQILDKENSPVYIFTFFIILPNWHSIRCA